MQEAYLAAVPMDSKFKLTIDGIDGIVSKEVNVPYRGLIGSLLYSTNTRPDINFAVNLLSRYNESYKLAHWELANEETPKLTLSIVKYSQHNLTELGRMCENRPSNYPEVELFMQ